MTYSMKKILSLLTVAWLGFAAMTSFSSSAYAFGFCSCDGCTCTLDQFIENVEKNVELHNETRFEEFGFELPIPFEAYDTHPGVIRPSPEGQVPRVGPPQGTERLGEHQEFLWDLWYDKFLPVWMFMAQQLYVTQAQHAVGLGIMMAAKQQLEMQTFLQQRMAETHKRYHPSVGMCVFGTNIRSLAASERRGHLTAHTLNQRLLDRQLGTENGPALLGPSSDQTSRVGFFLNRVCDRFDNNRIYDNPESGFANICDTAPRTTGTVNLDVDFTRLVMTPRTLDIDFVVPGASGSAQNKMGDHVFNLAANLYGHKVPTMLAIGSEGQVGLQSQLLDLRSVVAKRSVAQTSFSALVGMKARGTDKSGTDTLQYMAVLLEELGMSNDDAKKFLGEKPSYYAQLEVLAKKMYQNPGFYRELYDKPANTKRKSVAMNAIASMLDREIFDSQIRAEAMLSQLLELKVITAQDRVEDSFSRKGGP